MYQKVIISGNLGGDPVMRYTASGDPVTSFSVATSEKWTDKAGERQERTTWWKVSAWRKLAELCNEYLSKGRQVLVEGTMTVDENGGPRVWTGQDGEARASYEITASVVKFIGSRGKRDAAPDSGDEGMPF